MHEPKYRAQEQASNPVETLDWLPALQVHYENPPSAEPIVLRRARRAQDDPAAS